MPLLNSFQNVSVPIMEKESLAADGQSSSPRSVPGPGRWSTARQRRASVEGHLSFPGRGHVPAIPRSARLAPRRFETASALATVAFRLQACLCMVATETTGTFPPCTVDVRQRVNATSIRHRSGLGIRKAWQVSVSIRRLRPSTGPLAMHFCRRTRDTPTGGARQSGTPVCTTNGSRPHESTIRCRPLQGSGLDVG